MNPVVTADQLLELQRMATLGGLLASVAHELSAPVAVLLSNADVRTMLLDKFDAAAGDADRIRKLMVSAREVANVDHVACERVRRMVTSLKVAARAGGGEFIKSSINEILDASLLLANTQFRHRVEVRTEFAELPEIECQPDRLSQAFLNLLINAGQAIEDRGTVVAGTELAGDQVHVWISDTGRGIREEDQPKVLREGFTTKPVGIGTGLGLAIVRQIIVESHGGTITFESTVGKGTTFHVHLPLAHKKQGAAD